MMNLTLTYDHRLVDGAYAGMCPARPARPARDLGRSRVLSPLEGRCLCGGVRFEVTEPYVMVSQCHCEYCKRIAGGYGTVSGRARTDAIRDPRGRGAPALVHALRAGRRRRSARSAARTSSAAAGPSPRWLQRAPRRVRARLRPQARGAHVRPLGRSLGDPPRRRPAAVRDPRHLGAGAWSGQSRQARTIASAACHGETSRCSCSTKNSNRPAAYDGRTAATERVSAPRRSNVEPADRDDRRMRS